MERPTADQQARWSADLQPIARLEAVTALAAFVAHDIKNLMVTVAGNAELLRLCGESAVDFTPWTAPILASARHAGTLAEELLSYARGGRQEPRAVDLGEAITEVVGLKRGQVPPGVSLETDVAEGLWPLVGHPVHLRQIVLNLLSNALEASGVRGQVTVAARNLPADHDANRADRPAVLLTVRDTGSGMAPEVQQRAFEPYYSTKSRGSGLGLAATAAIVQAHGGWIHVDSQPQRGTRFAIGLPATPDAQVVRADEASAVTTPPTATPVTAPPKAAILVLDDETGVLDATAAMLQCLGYRALSARRREEALALCAEHTLALAIIDVDVPEADGEATLPELLRRCPGLRLLLTSGYGLSMATRALLTLQPARFLAKPYDLTSLDRAVRESLAARGDDAGA